MICRYRETCALPSVAWKFACLCLDIGIGIKGYPVVIGNLVDGVGRVLERASDNVSEALFEPVVRLGVTGLSRSGKTVFITSLVANLLDRGRMVQLTGARDGSILSAYLQPQPDDTLPRFEYEKHLGDMIGAKPKWPQSTRSISQLRLSFKVQSSGIISGMRGPRTVHLDIVDYPGEWLLDLPLLSQSFEQWSASSLELAGKGKRIGFAKKWLALDADPNAPLDEGVAQVLASAFTKYLSDCREAGYSACSSCYLVIWLARRRSHLHPYKDQVGAARCIANSNVASRRINPR